MKKTYQYIITTSEEMYPRHIADGFSQWLCKRVLHITDVQHSEGHIAYGQIYHVSDGIDNKPDEKE